MKQLSQIYLLTLLIVTCFTVLSGCSSVNYYRQAAAGHLALMFSTKPVGDWLAATDTPEPLKAKLRLSQQVRQFASNELKLPVGDAFSEFVELDRPWVLVNLVAVPEFSLEPHQWCYPVIGCQAYRGYYHLEDAQREAKDFTDRQYDTFIGGVTAYSTLGWFDDPLHSGFTRLSDARMVALMFHELAHQVVYVARDTTFNESFARAVELEGLKKWFQKQGETQGFEQAVERLRQRDQTAELVKATTAALRHLYRQKDTLAPAPMREQKAEILAQLRRDYLALANDWSQPGPLGADPTLLNNANLALFQQYSQYVPAFRQLFRESGQDFGAFYEAVRGLSDREPGVRETQLEALSQRFNENF